MDSICRQAEDVVDVFGAEEVVEVLTVAVVIESVCPADEKIGAFHVPFRKTVTNAKSISR